MNPMKQKTIFVTISVLVALAIGGIAGAGFGLIPEWVGLTVFFVGVAATLGYVFYGVSKVGNSPDGNPEDSPNRKST